MENHMILYLSISIVSLILLGGFFADNVFTSLKFARSARKAGVPDASFWAHALVCLNLTVLASLIMASVIIGVVSPDNTYSIEWVRNLRIINSLTLIASLGWHYWLKFR